MVFKDAPSFLSECIFNLQCNSVLCIKLNTCTKLKFPWSYPPRIPPLPVTMIASLLTIWFIFLQFSISKKVLITYILVFNLFGFFFFFTSQCILGNIPCKHRFVSFLNDCKMFHWIDISNILVISSDFTFNKQCVKESFHIWM